MNRPRVLLVDDEPQIRRVLRPPLTASGYELRDATTGHDALAAIADFRPDLVILDLGLPDMDGKEVLRRLRLMTARTPVIILSARDREAEKIAALDMGANDYVEKPFGIGELLARMRASLRAAPEKSGDEATVRSGSLIVDLHLRRVTKSGEAVHLTPKEFDLLALLAQNIGRPLTHRRILETVWGQAHKDDTQYLRVFVGQLRAKLEDNPATPMIIFTETGIGYRLASNEG